MLHFSVSLINRLTKAESAIVISILWFGRLLPDIYNHNVLCDGRKTVYVCKAYLEDNKIVRTKYEINEDILIKISS